MMLLLENPDLYSVFELNQATPELSLPGAVLFMRFEQSKVFLLSSAIITYQGADIESLSKNAIKRRDIKNENYQYTRVCSEHIVTGNPSSLTWIGYHW